MDEKGSRSQQGGVDLGEEAGYMQASRHQKSHPVNHGREQETTSTMFGGPSAPRASKPRDEEDVARMSKEEEMKVAYRRELKEQMEEIKVA